MNRKRRIASKWVTGGNKSGKSRGKSVDGLLAVAANKQIGGVSLELRTLTQPDEHGSAPVSVERPSELD